MWKAEYFLSSFHLLLAIFSVGRSNSSTRPQRMWANSYWKVMDCEVLFSLIKIQAGTNLEKTSRYYWSLTCVSRCCPFKLRSSTGYIPKRSFPKHLTYVSNPKSAQSLLGPGKHTPVLNICASEKVFMNTRVLRNVYFAAPSLNCYI